MVFRIANLDASLRRSIRDNSYGLHASRHQVTAQLVDDIDPETNGVHRVRACRPAGWKDLELLRGTQQVAGGIGLETPTRTDRELKPFSVKRAGRFDVCDA